MQHVTIRAALATPLALLLVAARAAAQQSAPVPEDDPTGVERANQTRELEGEIEDYPGPLESTPDSADPATRIPEVVQPAPSKPSAPTQRAPVTWGTSKPATSKPATSKPAPVSAIDPREVQRVLGSDMRLIAIESLDPPTVTRMQQRLQELGHYRGPIDGIAGPQTRGALSAYVRAQLAMKQRLLKHNQLTTDLAEQLGVEPSTSPNMPRPAPMPMSPPPGSPDRSSPLAPPQGSAPLPAPGMPLPTPSSAPPARGVPPAPANGVTPSAPPPSL